MKPGNEAPPEDDRRAFLKKCGTFAVITPPAVTFLLSTSMSSKAIAGSSGRIRDGDGGGGGVIGVLGAGAGAIAVGAAPRTAAPLAARPAAPPAQVYTPMAEPPLYTPPPPPVPSVLGERG